MKKRLIACMVFAGFLLFSMIPAQARTTWNANSVWPPGNHQTQALEQFAAMVKDVTDGDLNIVVSSGGALGFRGPELLAVVRDNLVPVSDMLISGVAGHEDLFGVVTLPFLAQNFEEAKLLNEIARPYFDKAAEKWNQKILYISPWPGAGLWTKEKVKSIGDMRGLKARTYDENGALVIEAAGGTPYALPFSEVYSSLATGMIDSVVTSTPTAVDANFWEVLNYYQPLNITIATNMVNVNLRAFNRLNEETQKALVEAGREMERIMWETVAELDREMEGISNEKGIETIPVSDELMEALVNITADIRKKYLDSASPEAREIVNIFLKEVGRQ